MSLDSLYAVSVEIQRLEEPLIALEMIEDTVRDLTGSDLEQHLNSESTVS